MNERFYSHPLVFQHVVENTLPYIRIYLKNRRPAPVPPPKAFGYQLKNKLLGMAIAYDSVGISWAADWIRRVLSMGDFVLIESETAGVLIAIEKDLLASPCLAAGPPPPPCLVSSLHEDLLVSVEDLLVSVYDKRLELFELIDKGEV